MQVNPYKITSTTDRKDLKEADKSIKSVTVGKPVSLDEFVAPIIRMLYEIYSLN